MTLFSSPVLLSDAIAGLRKLPDGAARLVLSDLPAGVTRAATDTPPDFDELWPEVWRVLASDGTAVFMAASFGFACETVASQKSFFRYDLIWEKTRATRFFQSGIQPLRAHEYILVFYRKLGVYNPVMSQGHPPINTAYRKPDTGHGVNYGPAPRAGHMSRAGATDRFPRSVLRTHTIANGPRRRHHQEKPQELLRWLVRTYTDEGELVVDPYAGSGAVGEASFSLGRRSVCFDHDPCYGEPAAGSGWPDTAEELSK